MNGLIHIIDLLLIHFDKMNTSDNYNGQTQQIQTDKNRKGGGKPFWFGNITGAMIFGRARCHKSLWWLSLHPKDFLLIVFKGTALLIMLGEEGITELMAGLSLKWQITLVLRKWPALCSESLKSYYILTWPGFKKCCNKSLLQSLWVCSPALADSRGVMKILQ